MDINQSTELSYVKINEIDTKVNEILDMVTDSNPESSTTLKELTNEIKTKTTNIENKVTTILENNNNVPEIDTSTLETQVAEMSSKIADMDTKVTTINSNASTINRNVGLINTDVTKIKDNYSTRFQVETINGKLDKLLKRVTIDNYEEFTEDPYKLNLDYTERLEINRNPDNYDCKEINYEFVTKNSIVTMIGDCDSNTFSYNITFTFTTTEDFLYVYFRTQAKTISQYIRGAGTHTITFSESDIEKPNGRIIYALYVSGNEITVHNVKCEIWGTNAKIFGDTPKYKIFNGVNYIAISKCENNKGYYLSLDKLNLHPGLLKEEYILAEENVKDFAYGYVTIKHAGIYKDYTCFRNYVKLDNIYVAVYGEDYHKYQMGSSYPAAMCSLGYYDGTNMYGTYLYSSSYAYPTASLFRHGDNTQYATTSSVCKQECSYIASISNLNPKNRFSLFSGIVTDLKGINYLFISNSNNQKFSLEIGYGKNATAFYDKDNPLNIRVYLNDNGYCVKYNILLNEDKTSAIILNNKIIGTYDYYYETDSDVYFVEKDKQLYMFKNNN